MINLFSSDVQKFISVGCLIAFYFMNFVYFDRCPSEGTRHINIRGGSVQELYRPPKNMGCTNILYPKISRVAILDEKISLIKIWKSHENPKISVFLNLIPRNIVGVSNFLQVPEIPFLTNILPKNITWGKHLTQKYRTEPPVGLCAKCPPPGIVAKKKYSHELIPGVATPR